MAQDGDEAGPQQSKGGLGGLFGGRSKAAADAPTGPQKQKKMDTKLVDAKPVGKEVKFSHMSLSSPSTFKDARNSDMLVFCCIMKSVS